MTEAALAPVISLALVVLAVAAIRRGPRPLTAAAAVVVTALAIAALRETDVMLLAVRLIRTAEVIPAVAVMAIAGHVLLHHSRSITERRVFLSGVLLVISGMSDYTSTPALLAGAVTGLVWTVPAWGTDL